jgi:hypothetical protein
MPEHDPGVVPESRDSRNARSERRECLMKRILAVVVTIAGVLACVLMTPGPGAANAATREVAPASSTTCVDNVRVSSETRGSAQGRGEIDCTKKSSVSNVQLILWERPANVKHGGWKNRGTRHPEGGFTPYDSDWRQALPCHSGYTIHYEMKADVITPDGGGPEIWNSNNARCQ